MRQEITVLPFYGRSNGTGFEMEAVVANLRDTAVIDQAIREFRCHFEIAKDGGSFAKNHAAARS